jgi:hypothetical protein
MSKTSMSRADIRASAPTGHFLGIRSAQLESDSRPGGAAIQANTTELAPTNRCTTNHIHRFDSHRITFAPQAATAAPKGEEDAKPIEQVRVDLPWGTTICCTARSCVSF